MSELSQDLVDIRDGIDTGFVSWATPHMRTKTGAALWKSVSMLLRRCYSAELELSEYKRVHGSDVDELRTLCDKLTKRVQELEEQ